MTKIGFAAVIGAALGLAFPAQAQTYSRTETTTYYDNMTKWVLGQTASVTCSASVPVAANCNGSAVSESTFDPTYAMPLTLKSYGKLQQTLAYDTTSAVSTGQLGTLRTVMDGNNNVTTFTNWKRGIPQTRTYADAYAKSAAVNDVGWITSITDENGFVTRYGYDAMGRLASIAYPTGDSTAWNTTTQAFVAVASTEYGIAAGHWRQTVSTGNGTKVNYYDALWRPLVVQEYDAGNVAGTQKFQRFGYDYAGRNTFTSYPGTTDALSTGTTTGYDALGRVTSMVQDSELGQLTTTTAYLSGFQARITDPKGNQTTTAYMAYDQPNTDWPVWISHPQGAYTHISRDVFGKPTRLRRSDSSVPTDGTIAVNRDYAYNANEELCRTVEPETGATLMGYDGAGNLKWSSAGLDSATACEAAGTSGAVAVRRVDRNYDARNRIQTLLFPDGRGNQTWGYAPDGLPASVAVNNSNGGDTATSIFAYNKRRLLTRETLATPAVNWPYDYSYDANGHLAANVWDGLNVSYAPNALGQPTQVGPYATGVSYYPNGGIQQFTYGNGIVHTTTQNARQLPSRSLDCVVAGCSTAADKRLDLSYTFDQNANVSQIVDGVNDRQTRGMVYDGLNRLTQTTSNMFGTASYSYDVLDNITRATVGASPTMPARDQFHCYTNNRLTSVNSGGCSGATLISLDYDVQGNLSNESGTAHGFDFGNRLRNVGTLTTYGYDGSGRRVQDSVNGSQKYSQYDRGGQLVMVADNRAGKVIEYFYLQGNLVALRERNTSTNVYTVKYQHTDALRSPIATTDASKTVLETTEYEPYGRQSNRAVVDGPGYTGHVQDSATGLTYMQQRYYDPILGRFLSVDPIVTDANTGKGFGLYTYVDNNPYTKTDPDGREPEMKMWADPKGMTHSEARSGAQAAGTVAIAGVGVAAVAVAMAPVATTVAAVAADTAATGSLTTGLLANAPAVNAAAVTVAEVATGGIAGAVTVTGMTGHAVDQAISRGVKPAQILDAIKNPLKIAAPKTDSLGRVSQKLVGEKASVVVNPESGKVVTVHPTSTKTAEKLKEINK